jgi:hypothetical protein
VKPLLKEILIILDGEFYLINIYVFLTKSYKKATKNGSEF